MKTINELLEEEEKIVVHCKTKKEIEFLIEKGFIYQSLSYPNHVLFRIFNGESSLWMPDNEEGYDYYNKLSIYECSDLMAAEENIFNKEEEVTAEEAIRWLMDGCYDDRFYDYVDESANADINAVFDLVDDPEDVIDSIKKWKEDRKKKSEEVKPPIVKMYWKGFGIDGYEDAYFSNEDDAELWCVRMADENPGREFACHRVWKAEE